MSDFVCDINSILSDLEGWTVDEFRTEHDSVNSVNRIELFLVSEPVYEDWCLVDDVGRKKVILEVVDNKLCVYERVIY